MTNLNVQDYFSCEKIKNNSFIYRWNLNNTPASPVERILILADLINACRARNQIVNLRPDKRVRKRESKRKDSEALSKMKCYKFK